MAVRLNQVDPERYAVPAKVAQAFKLKRSSVLPPRARLHQHSEMVSDGVDNLKSSPGLYGEHAVYIGTSVFCWS